MVSGVSWRDHLGTFSSIPSRTTDIVSVGRHQGTNTLYIGDGQTRTSSSASTPGEEVSNLSPMAPNEGVSAQDTSCLSDNLDYLGQARATADMVAVTMTEAKLGCHIIPSKTHAARWCTGGLLTLGMVCRVGFCKKMS